MLTRATQNGRAAKVARTIILAIALFVAAPALAIVIGGSNLGFLGYPKHDCHKPYYPTSFSSEWERDRYIDEWNAFIDCINEYVEAGKNDIDRINEAQREAISDAGSRY